MIYNHKRARSAYQVICIHRYGAASKELGIEKKENEKRRKKVCIHDRPQLTHLKFYNNEFVLKNISKSVILFYFALWYELQRLHCKARNDRLRFPIFIGASLQKSIYFSVSWTLCHSTIIIIMIYSFDKYYLGYFYQYYNIEMHFTVLYIYPLEIYINSFTTVHNSCKSIRNNLNAIL